VRVGDDLEQWKSMALAAEARAVAAEERADAAEEVSRLLKLPKREG